jgi:DNA-directed RNA polymerase II subunit RPB2
MADTWNAIDDYFACNSVVKHQLESYNNFVRNVLPPTVEMYNPIAVATHGLNSVRIEIRDPVLLKPVIFERDGACKLMTPRDARDRGYTYSAVLVGDVHVFTSTVTEPGGPVESSDAQIFPAVPIGKVSKYLPTFFLTFC